MTKIKDVVGEGRVLADANSGVVRLWCETPDHSSTRRAIKRYFPCADFRGGITRLGGWHKLTNAIHDLAEAKMMSYSIFIRQLHLFEDSTGEGMRTIRQIS